MFHKIYIILLISIFIIVSNCNNKKVSSNHGYKALDIKIKKIYVNKTNKNDVVKIIGPPSFKSNFDDNIWYYVERRKTNQDLKKLGIKKIEINNTLSLKFNNFGILVEKKIIPISEMKELKFAKDITEKDFTTNNFLFNVFSSLREKMNAPSRKTIPK